MTKQLHAALLFISLSLAGSVYSQEKEVVQSLTRYGHDIMILDLSNALESNLFLSEEDFSYILDSDHKFHNHINHNELDDNSHAKDMSLIDIISSDEGADLNCSGGFCMDKSHFHKRGLTLKKQLFNYFMKISC